VPFIAFPYGVGEIEVSFDADLFTARLGALEASGPELRVVLGRLLDDDPRRPTIRALAGLIIEELLTEAQTQRKVAHSRR
jgi:hypothetical protein